MSDLSRMPFPRESLTCRSPAAKTVVVAGLLLFGAACRADVVLNWSQVNALPTFSGTTIVHGTTSIPGQTPFIYERVLDSDGAQYYHLVVGDPNAGFAQEVYIQVVTGTNVGNSFSAIGPQLSASLGSTGGGANPPASNAADPLSVSSSVSGNVSANPERVQMRQIVNDSELSLEFLKEGFLGKPRISTIIESDRHTAAFIMDGSDISFDDLDTVAPVINTLHIHDADMPAESAGFDMNTDSQFSSVTAGRYSYVPGAARGASGGTYDYFDGGANPNPDWSSFFDDREANPWSYPDNRPD